MTHNRLVRYAARLHDDRLLEEANDWVRSMGYDPAQVKQVEHVPGRPPKKDRLWITHYVLDADGQRVLAGADEPVDEFADDDGELPVVYLTEDSEEILRTELPTWWVKVCEQSDEPLSAQE